MNILTSTSLDRVATDLLKPASAYTPCCGKTSKSCLGRKKGAPVLEGLKARQPSARCQCRHPTVSTLEEWERANQIEFPVALLHLPLSPLPFSVFWILRFHSSSPSQMKMSAEPACSHRGSRLRSVREGGLQVC